MTENAIDSSPKSASITPDLILRFLCFRADAIQHIARDRKSLLVGGLLVISAGFAREYDGENLIAEPWHLLLPLAASVLGCAAMVLLLYIAARSRSVHEIGIATTFLGFLSLYWMTAPMAWLYAIPVERFLSPADATRANLGLLGFVAVWRVALMVRCVSVLYGSTLKSAFAPIILFSDILALLALKFVPGPIFMIMGGVRLSESENILLGFRLMLGFWGFVSLLLWIPWYIAVCWSKAPWKWFDDQEQKEVSGHISRSTWAIISIAFLIWIPILPSTQSEQQLRWEAERLLAENDISGFCDFMNHHPEDEFPPHWDPPPRIGYGEYEPPVHQVVAQLLRSPSPPWLLNRYLDKLGVEAERMNQWSVLSGYSDEDFAAYVETLAQLDSRDQVIQHYRVYNHLLKQTLESEDIAASRRASLQRLMKLIQEGKPEDQIRED